MRGDKRVVRRCTTPSPQSGCSPVTSSCPSSQCRELRGFIRPLAELLEGLRRGRYDRGLSSFQQSVAMDRLQRIIGVLQKPEMGARYLGTLLQVEAMLRLWFPHVAPKPALDPAPAAAPPRRRPPAGPAGAPRRPRPLVPLRPPCCGTPSAHGAFSPGCGQGRREGEPRDRAHRTGPHGCPPGSTAPSPGSAPPEVPGHRKSLPTEVPPQVLPVRARSGGGITGSVGERTGSGTGLTGASWGRGEVRSRGSPS
uniref:Circadian-associated transcriptional repressor n=1 Tax=Catharus ustulatus TaxID=91951 RepID=A0A8C3UQ18_CATUS